MKKIHLSYSLMLLCVVFLAFSLPAVSQTRYNTAQATETFKFSTWNTEWLSCSQNSPNDDELQINNVVAVIKAMNSDLVAIQEVGTSATYATVDTIVRRLGTDWGGSIIPSSNDNCAQNQGIVYKKARVQLVSASLLTNSGASYDWSSGRYPVQYNVNLLVNGTTVPVSFINIHAKAMGDATSYARRKSASEALKALLDGSTYTDKKVILLGDFNDYLTGTQCSACSPADSPYKNFVDDNVNYNCLTTGLTDPYYSSPVIDNIIISNELFDNYKANSTVREVTATQNISNYANTTSDHTPISATFNFSAGNPPCENLSFSETFASNFGQFTPYSVSGNQVWTWKSIYGATVSGYASAVNNENEDWLISPAFDLSGKTSATLTFSHALNYCPNQTDIVTNQTLWVSTNYNSGAPSTATWTQLNIPVMPSGSSWTFINSGNVVIPVAKLQSNVHFAFKYLSGTTVAGTWEIKDLTLTATCTATDVKTPATAAQSKVFAIGRTVMIDNASEQSISVFDITGRLIFAKPSVRQLELPMHQAGVYMVRIGSETRKIMCY